MNVSDSISFFCEFLRHPLQTGAILPSSAALAALMIDAADVKHAASIAELGSGTGVCTERIQARKPSDAPFVVLEINPAFVRQTRKRCPDVDVRCDSAIHLSHYLACTDGRGFDAILSGLPWADFREQVQGQLLHSVEQCLAPGGRFVTFAYLQGMLFPAAHRFRRRLRATFPDVCVMRVVWANVPPAFVYCATKKGVRTFTE